MYKRIGLLCSIMLAALAAVGHAQMISATLTGVVSDVTEAVVPHAKVTVTNLTSLDVRRSVTNDDGYFTFASLPAGTYKVMVEAPGFIPYELTDLQFTGAEKRNVTVLLKLGSTTEKVEVTSAVDLVTPVDSGEKAAVLTTKQLQDFSVVGRSAAEFIKILPGFAISGTGTENRSNYNGEVIGINGNGDGGSQSALNNAFNVNGLPTNSLDLTTDVAQVPGPRRHGPTPANPNKPM